MRDHPMIYRPEMVRALLSGAKPQTRRLLKGTPIGEGGHGWTAESIGDALVIQSPSFNADTMERTLQEEVITSPYSVGDRIWVREKHSFLESSITGQAPSVWYWADGSPSEGDYTWPRPSIHMPRWASRLTLVITDVRIERLQDISEADAKAEGIVSPLCVEVASLATGRAGYSYQAAFAQLWNSIHTKPGRRWEDNPWVSALTIEVHHCNIDQMERAA